MASLTRTWIASPVGSYGTLEMFTGDPFTKAESAGALENPAEHVPLSAVERAEDGSFANVFPVKPDPDFTTNPHPVEAAAHGACAVNETDSVVDELAVMPRPWIWLADARVTPGCDDESTDEIDQPEGAVRLNELADPPVVLSVNE